MRQALGRGYNKTVAEPSPLFQVVKPSKVSRRKAKEAIRIQLPKPRALMSDEYVETNARSSYYIDARVQVGHLWWKRWVEFVIRNRA